MNAIPDYVDESHKLFWPMFCNWAKNSGIGEEPEDREVWWNCFVAGATAMYLEFKKGTIS